MRGLFYLISILCIGFSQTAVSQKETRKVTYTLDPKGKKTSDSFASLAKKYPENAMAFRMTKDSGRVYQYSAPKYSAYKINPAALRNKIEKITGKTFSEATTFILFYLYKDDVCSDWYSNTFNRDFVLQSKDYHDPFKNFLEKKYQNAVFLVLFEEGIALSNDANLSDEYFFLDTANEIKTLLFKNPTVCGSFALSRENGTTLVYNGENRPDTVAQNLDPEIWNKIFTQQKN